MKNSKRSPNRPGLGSDLTVEPITNRQAIQRIRANLKHKPRDRCLFVLGINTAYRVNELLSIKVGQVAHLQVGDDLNLRQSKTKTHRAVTLNKPVIATIQKWLREHPDPRPTAPLFRSRTGRALTVPTVNIMVKEWCAEANLSGKYGCHTLRKTWGHWAYKLATHIPPEDRILEFMDAFQHSHPSITRRYIGHQRNSLRRIYLEVRL